jgi:hypothetical protein
MIDHMPEMLSSLVEALALVFFAYCLLISFAVPYAQELAIGHTESVQQT